MSRQAVDALSVCNCHKNASSTPHAPCPSLAKAFRHAPALSQLVMNKRDNSRFPLLNVHHWWKLGELVAMSTSHRQCNDNA